jgi:hypothetical protein
MKDSFKIVFPGIIVFMINTSVCISILLFFLSIGTVRSDIVAGHPMGCKSESYLKKVSLHGKVLLHDAFMPASLKEKVNIREEAIESQVKHLMSYLKNSADKKSHAVLSSFRGKIGILKIEKAKYGSSFSVDSYLPTSRGIAQSSYIKKALLRGSVDKNDNAEIIHYQIELMVADCSEKTETLKKTILPLDPFLSFWIEQKNKRLPRGTPPVRLEGISNCLSDEILLFGNADVSWYFWSPLKCHLDAQVTYSPEINELEKLPKIKNLKEDFLSSPDLKLSAIFGIIDSSSYFAPIDIQKMKNLSFQKLTQCQKINVIAECLTLWKDALGPQKDDKYFEPGAFHFFNFLKFLNTFITIKKIKMAEDQSPVDILISLEGTLIDSGTPVVFDVYYGKTSLDYGPRVSMNYLKLLHDSFNHYDSISYVGHAGLGQNLKVEVLNKLWKEEKLSPVMRSKPLWLGIYNCQAFSYFGPDLKGLFKKGTFRLFLTETTGMDSGAKFPLSQFYYLNAYLSKKANKASGDINQVMGQYTTQDQFLTVLEMADK